MNERLEDTKYNWKKKYVLKMKSVSDIVGHIIKTSL